MSLRQRIEDALGAWAHMVGRYRWPVAIASLAVTAWLAAFIPQMEVKMASEDFLFEDDPVRARYDAFKAEFGQDQIASLVISPPEIFDLAFLEKLRAFHEELEDEVPYLEDITSLVNVRSTYGRGDELLVDDLLEEMPTNEAELQALRERALTTPFYRKTGVLSDDGLATAVRIEVAVYGAGDDSAVGADALASGFEEGFEEGFDDGSGDGAPGRDEWGGGFESDPGDAIGAEGGGAAGTGKRPFLSGVENARLIETIHRIVARYQGPDFPIHAAGGTMMTYELTKALGRDVPRFFGGGLLVIGLFLVLLFRRLSPVLLCFAVVVPAALTTFGLAALLRLPFSAPSQLVPSFLLAIGVSYSVHLVTIFLRDLGEGRDRVASLEHAMRHSGLPILMTGLTTTAGLMSFYVAEMKPIQEMGMISSIGVVVMLAYSMVLLPALMAILPLEAREARPSPLVDGVLGWLAATSARHPGTIVGVTAVLVVAAIGGMTLLYTSSDPLSWFPKDHPYSLSSDLVNERFLGTSAIEVVVDTGRENGLHEPALLRRLEALEALVEKRKRDGARLSRTSSVLDIVKETHQALNENDAGYYVVPDERRLLAQELLLFENSGSDDLEKVVDSQFSRARFTIGSRWTDGAQTAPFLETFEPEVSEVFGDSAQLVLTGLSPLIARTVEATYQSMLRSYALALALITPLMIVLIGSLRSGLVSMVPNLVPILFTMGMMGVTGIPIDMFTLLAGCIAIGLAVDDSIHFISSFRRYLAQGLDPVRAVEETMHSTGRALLFTSIVLTSGFAVLFLSEMLNLRQVGALTSFAIVMAFLLDVTVTPALLVLTHRRKAAAVEDLDADPPARAAA